jgi:hypothetical protein
VEQAVPEQGGEAPQGPPGPVGLWQRPGKFGLSEQLRPLCQDHPRRAGTT